MIGTAQIGLDPVTESLFERVGFKPEPEQLRILQADKRFILVTGGEQGGKSMVASKHLLKHFFADIGNISDHETILYWLVAADYEGTRAEFDYVLEDLTALLGSRIIRSSKRVDPGYIEVWEPDRAKPLLRVETKSAKDPRTIRMRAPHGILGCEASQLDLITFERLQGRSAPKRGWLFLSGTLEGSLGWYPQIKLAWESGADDQQSFELPAWSNTTLYPGGRNDPEILRLEKESSDDFFLERIAGKSVPPRGLVFGEFRPDIHVKNLKWVKGEPVHLWVDPGYAGAYAVEAVQEINGQLCVFDEIYEQGLITEDIIKIVQDRPWVNDVKFGVIDIAGRQHQAMTAPAEQWLKKPAEGGMGLYMSAKPVRINEGTERLKGFLKPDPIHRIPKLVIHSGNTGILSEFGAVPSPFDGQTRAYRWKTDREGNIVGETPDDRYNHGIKATIYGIVDRYGYGYVRSREKIKVKRWRSDEVKKTKRSKW